MNPEKAIPIVEKIVGLSPEQLSWLFACLIAISLLLCVIYAIRRERRHDQEVVLEPGENGRSQSSKEARELRRAVGNMTTQVAAMAADLVSAQRRLDAIGGELSRIAQIVHEDHAMVDEHGQRLKVHSERIGVNASRIATIEGKIAKL